MPICLTTFQFTYYFIHGHNNEHKSGELSIEDSLKEPTYDISIKAVKLKKLVQMYQVFF